MHEIHTKNVATLRNAQNALPKLTLTITFWKNYKNNARDTNYFTNFFTKCLCDE